MNERYSRKAALCAAFLLLLGILSSRVYAQVAISPVRIDLSAANTKDVIRVKSQAETARSYQVEVVAWSQSAGERESYAPTEDILAVPPLFTLKPGAEQIVRIGMMAEPEHETEKAYRMFITELAPPQHEERKTSGVNVRLRLGLPVFVAPQAPQRVSLDHIDSEQADGKFHMQFRNSGNTHVRISEIRYRAPGMQEPQVEAAAIYILAGQTGYVPVSLSDGPGEGTVTLVTDTAGNVEYDLSASP